MKYNQRRLEPSEYALKDYTKEQLVEYALHIQKELEKADNEVGEFVEFHSANEHLKPQEALVLFKHMETIPH